MIEHLNMQLICITRLVAKLTISIRKVWFDLHCFT